MQELGPDDPREISGYALRARLGEGGMGTVYLSHTRGGRPVALKVVRREYGNDPEFRRRFGREVEAARRVQGPFTAAVLDSNTEGAQPWLASEYVSGPSLSAAVGQYGPLPSATVLQLMAGVAEALKMIHAAGVIHRDLKPSNVLLAADGPRVIDFGIARAADATALTGTDVRLGTPAFMAPEQVSGRDISPALDIFATGLIGYFAAAGQHPFGEGASQALLYRIVAEEPELSGAPAELRELLARCLAKEPGARPTTDQVIDLCRSHAGGETVLERRGDWWLPPQVAEDVTRAEETLRLSGQQPLLPARAYEPTVASQAPAHPAAAQPRARGRVRTIAIAVAALLVGVGATLAATQLGGGDGDGGDSGAPGPAKNEAGWKLEKKDVPLNIRAPQHFTDKLSNCDAATTTALDLDHLEVATAVTNDGDDMYNGDVRYVDCYDRDPRNGFGLVDGSGVWGTTDESTPTPSQCKAAAREGSLDSPVTVKQIQTDSVLKKDMGLCIETDDKTVVHLWITRINKQPDNHNLRTYITTATQWVPKK
ncbi:serine/threonine protein kinase [Streptomyces sp. A7024]|uniref:Serine/threonine protein kinase n=1 Tax=Streptomyces coryli TaxID=1128680 RepID=A0A6G4U2F7_9ACTN|nr:serine/threonine-protein kinase [Streptomyces coryli]NGN66344.1 serine/threonine protein kinase [Streptomyces coryli]